MSTANLVYEDNINGSTCEWWEDIHIISKTAEWADILNILGYFVANPKVT